MKTEVIKREKGKKDSEFLLIVWSDGDKKQSTGFEMSKDDIHNLYVQLSNIVKANIKE